MDAITLPLYNYYQRNITVFCKYDNELLSEASELFDLFLEQIHASNNTLRKFVLFEQGRDKKRIKKSSKHFVFIYDVFDDGTSKFRMQHIQSCSMDYNAQFLLSKFKLPEGYVYFLSSDHGFKIGKTNNIERRVSEFNIQLPFEFNLHSFIKSERYETIESDLHDIFASKRINGEWFDLNDSDFDEIKGYCKTQNLIINTPSNVL